MLKNISNEIAIPRVNNQGCHWESVVAVDELERVYLIEYLADGTALLYSENMMGYDSQPIDMLSEYTGKIKWEEE